MSGGKIWVLVLAAGEGTRLRSLTRTAGGLYVPKQFCSLRGGASLLDEALARGESVTSRERVVAVVAERHRRWWAGRLPALPGYNVIVQPDNRGTAAGLLLPLLHIVERDPEATVLVLPSDHFVRDEHALAGTLRRVIRLAGEDRRHAYLLGLAPSQPDTQLGYIVPTDTANPAAAHVQRFVEKPTVELARALLSQGALCNMFIIAASAAALVRLYAERHPALVTELAEVVRRDRLDTQDPVAARAVYRKLPTLDFSRNVLEGQESLLRVVAVPDCGWSDLGTPVRVAETLASMEPQWSGDAAGTALINLAEQHARLGCHGGIQAHG